MRKNIILTIETSKRSLNKIFKDHTFESLIINNDGSNSEVSVLYPEVDEVSFKVDIISVKIEDEKNEPKVNTKELETLKALIEEKESKIKNLETIIKNVKTCISKGKK